MEIITSFEIIHKNIKQYLYILLVQYIYFMISQTTDIIMLNFNNIGNKNVHLITCDNNSAL